MSYLPILQNMDTTKWMKSASITTLWIAVDEIWSQVKFNIQSQNQWGYGIWPNNNHLHMRIFFFLKFYFKWTSMTDTGP